MHSSMRKIPLEICFKGKEKVKWSWKSPKEIMPRLKLKEREKYQEGKREDVGGRNHLGMLVETRLYHIAGRKDLRSVMIHCVCHCT